MRPQRLVVEYTAVRERFGESPRWCCNHNRTRFWWEWNMPVETYIFPLVVKYPDNYPFSSPSILLSDDTARWLYKSFKVLRIPHVISGGREICWRYGDNSRHRNQWNPATDTAALCFGVGYRWCLAFLVWYKLGNWPVRDSSEDGSRYD